MSKKIKGKVNLVFWVFGLIFSLCFFLIAKKTIWTTIYSVLFATTLIPPLSKHFFKKIRIRFVWSKVLVSLVFLCLLIYSEPSSSSKTLLTSKVSRVTPTTSLAVNDLYKVTRIVDGDTIEVEKNNIKSTVRLIGIDTPEIADSQKSTQCYAKEAAEKAKLILLGNNVYLENDLTQEDKDMYGRLLRYIVLSDGTNFNKQLLLEGYGREYTFKNIAYKYQSEFREAENIAKITKKGLWNLTACQTISATPTTAVQSNDKFSCEVKKNICSQMTSCLEAMFYLKSCNIARLDGNNDGIPCENICK